MPRFTINVPDEINDWLESQDYDSKSKAARENLEIARRIDEAGKDVNTLIEDANRAPSLERDLKNLQDAHEKLRVRLKEAEKEAEHLRERTTEVDELENEIERLQRDLEQKENELQEERRKVAARPDKLEDVNELVVVEKRTQSIQERRARASWFKRMKWGLTGMPADEGD